MKRMAGLSLLATAVVSFGFNKQQGVTAEDAVNVGQAVSQDVGKGLGVIESGAGDSTQVHAEATPWPNVELSTSEKGTAAEEVVVRVGEKWAQQYAADPEAGELTAAGENVMNQLGVDIDSKVAQGYKVTEVTVQGFASQEGETGDSADPAGLRTPNPENVELADVRAGVLKDAIEQGALDTQGAEVKVIPGQEVQQTEEAMALADHISNMAQQLGMSELELVRTFNRDPDSLPEDVIEGMKPLIEQRQTIVMVSLEKEDTTTHSIYIIPVVIPLWRRDKNDKSKKKNNTDAPTSRITPVSLPAYHTDKIAAATGVVAKETGAYSMEMAVPHVPSEVIALGEAATHSIVAVPPEAARHDVVGVATEVAEETNVAAQEAVAVAPPVAQREEAVAVARGPQNMPLFEEIQAKTQARRNHGPDGGRRTGFAENGASKTHSGYASPEEKIKQPGASNYNRNSPAKGGPHDSKRGNQRSHKRG